MSGAGTVLPTDRLTNSVPTDPWEDLMTRLTYSSRRGALASATGAVAGVALGLGAAWAQDFAPSQVEMIVPYAEGGGSTIHARLLAGPLARAMPSSPTMIVRNVPGAGSVVGINEFAATSRPDGMMIAALGTGTFFQYLLENPAVQYPLPAFRPFLASPFGVVVYARKDFGFSGEDYVADTRHAIANRPIYCGDGPTAADLPILVTYSLMGIDIQAVFGMSNAEARGGFERGECQINFDNMASWAAGVEPLIEEGEAVALFTLGYEVDGQVVRDPMTPDIPTFLEVYEEIHGAPLSGIEYDVWKMLFDIRVMASKMFVLPPETPDAIVQVYADALVAALESPALQSEAAQDVLGPYQQVTGIEGPAAVLAGAAQVSDEQREWLRNWLAEVYDVRD